MGLNRRMPGDFAVVALSLEADQRGTSYGKLVAATTEEEREQITEKWKRLLYEKEGLGRRRSPRPTKQTGGKSGV